MELDERAMKPSRAPTLRGNKVHRGTIRPRSNSLKRCSHSVTPDGRDRSSPRGQRDCVGHRDQIRQFRLGLDLSAVTSRLGEALKSVPSVFAVMAQ